MRVKGYKDIKTSRNLRRKAEKGDFRSQSSFDAIQQSARKSGPRTNEPKAWVFVPEPKFARYQKTLLVDKVQEPNTEVFEEAELAMVIAEIPGVHKKEDVQVNVEGDVFIIEAIGSTVSGKRKFIKEVLIPFQIDPGNIQFLLNNEIMEITLHPLKKEK